MKFFFHSMDLAPRLNVDPARLIGLVLSLVLLPFQASNAAGTGFSPLGERQIPGLTELSGLAVSGLQQDHHWALNDSGHAASLFELDENLNLVREIAISQVLNRDWEDLASFQLDGIPYLLVADTGNNFRLRSEVSLILLREPSAREFAPVDATFGLCARHLGSVTGSWHTRHKNSRSVLESITFV